MSAEERRHWNKRYEAASAEATDDAPSPLLDHLPTGDGRIALDVGCGRLRNSRKLARLGYRVIAADGARSVFRGA